MTEPRELPIGIDIEKALQLSQAETPIDLSNIIHDLLDEGIITEEEGLDLYNMFYDQVASAYFQKLGIPPEAQTYISGFTSKADLADRINRLGIDQTAKTSIYQMMSDVSPEDLAIRGAGEREVSEQQKLQQQQEQAQVQREQRAKDLTQALDYTFNNPNVTSKDLAGVREEIASGSEAFLAGESDDVFNRLTVLNQKAAERSAGEGQRAESLLGGMMRPAQEEARQTPQIPEALGVAKTFLEGTKLGEGTKLRSFIESEIADLYEETKGARDAWWKQMNQPQVEDTFENEQSRISSAATQWGQIAGSAPSAEVAGGTYYGPGGLKAIAERAYQTAQRNLAGLKPGDFPGTQPTEVGADPFQTALRKKNFKAEYYRQPGTGLSRALTPAVRY